MAVSMSRSGGTLTVTVTENVADIVAAAGISNAEKRVLALRRVADQFENSLRALVRSDAEIDAAVAAETARGEAMKAARPTGSL